MVMYRADNKNVHKVEWLSGFQQWEVSTDWGVHPFMVVQPDRDAIAHSAYLGDAVAGFVYIKCWQFWQKRHQSDNGALAGERREGVRIRKYKGPTLRVPDEL